MCPKHVEQAIRSAIKTSVASSWHFISTDTHIFRCSDKFHFQLRFKFCIVIYYMVLRGCPYIISCVVNCNL